jgi:hypothetical protein
MITKTQLNQVLECMMPKEKIKIRLSSKYDNKWYFIENFVTTTKRGNDYQCYVLTIGDNQDWMSDEKSVNIDKITEKSIHVYSLNIFGEGIRYKLDLEDVTLESKVYEDDMLKAFEEWKEDGNVIVVENYGSVTDDVGVKFYSTQDSQWRNRIPLTDEALFDYYKGEFGGWLHSLPSDTKTGHIFS